MNQSHLEPYRYRKQQQNKLSLESLENIIEGAIVSYLSL